MSGWLRRKRLDVPEVRLLLGALDKMLDDWAETAEGSPERNDLWRMVHRASSDLFERAYGGASLAAQVSYWLRPYDARLDDRVWRWQRPGPCRVIDLTDGLWSKRNTSSGHFDAVKRSGDVFKGVKSEN